MGWSGGAHFCLQSGQGEVGDVIEGSETITISSLKLVDEEDCYITKSELETIH